MTPRASSGILAAFVLIALFGFPTHSYAADCAESIEEINEEQHKALRDMEREVSRLAEKLARTDEANEANKKHREAARDIRETASDAISDSSEEASECPNNLAVQAALATAITQISAAETDAHRAANQLLAEWHATHAPATTTTTSTTTTTTPPTLPPTTSPQTTLPPAPTSTTSTTTTPTTTTSTSTTTTTTLAAAVAPTPPAPPESSGTAQEAASPQQFPTTGFIEVSPRPPLTAATGSVAGNIGIALRTVIPSNVTIAVLSPLVVIEMMIRAFTAAGSQVFLPSILLTMFLGAVLRRRDQKALLELTS